MRRATNSKKSWEQPQLQSQQRHQGSSQFQGFLLGALVTCLVLSVSSRIQNFGRRPDVPVAANVQSPQTSTKPPLSVKGKVTIPTDVYVVDEYHEPLSRQLPTKPGSGVMKPSLEHFRPDQGLETTPMRITDADTVQAHMRFYYGTNATSPPPTLIYFVTPTYKRVTQIADLIRLANTLDHDCAIYWIVVEDATGCSKRVRDILDRTGLPYAHVAAKTPPPPSPLPKNFKVAKGVEQRNVALDVIEYLGLEGVVYFGDDDNAYDLRMFPELRRTKRVGTFGVAYAGGGTYERCMVNPKSGKVATFVTNWIGGRQFPVDMGSLSFHTSVLLTEKRPRFAHDWGLGYLETRFLELLISSKHELEPLMNNCQRMYVYHVKTEYPYWKSRQVPISMEKQDNLHSKIFPAV